MRLFSTIVTFLFITSSYNTTWALPGEGAESQDPILQNGQLFTPDQVAHAAKSQLKMAEAVCAGNREGVVGYQLKNLMEVGLYNYCDQYKDDDRFCRCVSEVTYENKVSSEEVENFKKDLEQESKKNIALNSFKVLKEYRQLLYKELVNKPLDLNSEKKIKSYSYQTCDDNKRLSSALAPFCKESDLVQLKKSFSLALSECEDCEGMDINNMSQASESRRKRTPGEDFLHFPTYWLGKKFDNQILEDAFSLNKINKNYPDNLSRFKSIGDFQYKELVEHIASRIKKKWEGAHPLKNIGVNRLESEKRIDVAFLVNMNDHYLFKDLKGLPRKKYLYNESNLKEDVDTYVDYFSSKIPQTIFDKRTMTEANIASFLEAYLEEEHRNKLDNKCKQLVEVMKDSCSAISKNDLSFDFDNYVAGEIREKKYKDNKFKFDQFYCIAKDKYDTGTYESFLQKLGVRPGLESVKNSKNLFKNKILSLKDFNLTEANFTSGVSLDTSETLATGNNNQYIDLLLGDNKDISKAESFGESIFKNAMIESGVSPNIFDPFNKSNLTSNHFSGTAISNYINSPTQTEIANDLVRRALKSRPEGEVSTVEQVVIEEPIVEPLPLDNLSNHKVEAPVTAESKESETIDQNQVSNSITSESVTSNNDAQQSISPTGENFGQLPTEPSNFNFSSNNFNSRSPAISQLNSSRFTKVPSEQEIMESRIKELEEKLGASISKDGEDKSQEELTGSDPSKNSFAKTDSSTEENIELNKLKIELEKMKLQMAKSDLENKKLRDKQASVVEKVKTTARDTSLSPLERASSKSVINSKTKRSPASTSSAITNNSNSQTRSESNSSSGTSSQAPSSTSTATESIGSRANGSGSRNNPSGGLLTATQADDNQLLGPQVGTEVSYQNFSDISSAGQNELEKLYSEFGTQLITQGGTEVVLEKDETTGEIKVVERDKGSIAETNKALTKRAPASVEDTKEERKSRKRFSLQEFNQIIDEGVKEK